MRCGGGLLLACVHAHRAARPPLPAEGKHLHRKPWQAEWRLLHNNAGALTKDGGWGIVVSRCSEGSARGCSGERGQHAHASLLFQGGAFSTMSCLDCVIARVGLPVVWLLLCYCRAGTALLCRRNTVCLFACLFAAAWSSAACKRRLVGAGVLAAAGLAFARVCHVTGRARRPCPARAGPR